MRFRKLPVEIEAIQWDGTIEMFLSKIIGFVGNLNLLEWENECIESEGFHIRIYRRP